MEDLYTLHVGQSLSTGSWKSFDGPYTTMEPAQSDVKNNILSVNKVTVLTTIKVVNTNIIDVESFAGIDY